MEYKKIIIIFLVFFNSFLQNLYSQNPINDTVVDYDIQINKYNVLYSDIDNNINISFKDTLPEKITITASAGTISGENGNYIYKYRLIGSAEIRLDYNFKFSNGFKYKGQINCNIIDTNINPMLSKTKGNYISRSMLIDYPYIDVIKKDTILTNIKVISFSVSSNNYCSSSKSTSNYKLKKTTFTRFNIKGNKLTEEAIAFLNMCTLGMVYIENIIAKDENGTLIDLPPITFFVSG